MENRIDALESKPSRKDEVITEIMLSHVELKKTWPKLKKRWVEPDIRDDVMDYIRYWSNRTEIIGKITQTDSQGRIV